MKKDRRKRIAEPRLGVAVDIVLFTVVQRRLEVLLTHRMDAPFAGCWSLPGGVVGPEESADDAATRELESKTGVRGVFLTTDKHDNDIVNEFYQRLDWILESTFQTPEGRLMNRYVFDFEHAEPDDGGPVSAAAE